MENRHSVAAVGRGTLMVRSLPELHDPDGQSLPVEAAVARWAQTFLRQREDDAVLVFLLGAAGRVRAVHETTANSLRGGPFGQQQVFRAAVVFGASQIVLAHGRGLDDHAKSECFQIDTALRRVGEIIGVGVLNHVVIGPAH